MTKKLLIGLATGVVVFGMVGVSNAISITYNFTFENDGSLTDPPFGTLMVNDNISDTLQFKVTADTVKLGAGADIHEFGFMLNFAGPLTLIPGTPGSAAFKTGGNAKKVSGRNSIFDHVVDFGSGGTKYNPVSFSISGVGLAINAITTSAGVSSQKNKPRAQFMMHVQNTSLSGPGSEAVGGSYSAVPIPTTMLLFGTGIAGLVGLKIRRKKGIADL